MEGIEYEEAVFRLEPGDTLLLASDGALDALNAEGEFYDAGRFVETIRRNVQNGVSGLLKALHSDISRFVGGAELSDDITAIALNRKR